MAKTNPRTAARTRRRIRIRKRVTGTADRPRMTVFRSNKHIYAQLVDDVSGTTLAASSTHKVTVEGVKSNRNAAASVGTAMAEAAKKAGVKTVIFDRNGYKYHGRVKALADAAREGGLSF